MKLYCNLNGSAMKFETQIPSVCPPKPKQGYTMYFDYLENRWIFVQN